MRAFVIGRSPALAAGVTWTLVIASAPWAARAEHTTVIDAAGAIYVIGGYGGPATGHFNDVWASTNGGADRARALLGGILGVLLRSRWLQGYIG
jgi:hypothetical protein